MLVSDKHLPVAEKILDIWCILIHPTAPTSDRYKIQRKKGKMSAVMKEENINHEAEDDDHQDFLETEMDDQFDESTHQDYDKEGTDNFPNDNSKGMFIYLSISM